MLPGWGDTAGTFRGIVDQLKDNYTIYAIDLPGFGGTQTPEKAWGLEDYAAFVKAWLKKIDIEHVYALIGHSHGGATAIYGIGNNILKADNLILLASAGVRNQRSVQKSILLAGAKAAKLPLMLLPASQRKSLRRKFYAAAGSDLLLLPHMEQTFKKIVSQDVQASAMKVSIPTLLIYGSRDKATPIRQGHILNRLIRGSRLEVIGAGHFVHQDEPQTVATLIRNFLKAD